jgi:hypothetical protein
MTVILNFRQNNVLIYVLKHTNSPKNCELLSIHSQCNKNQKICFAHFPINDESGDFTVLFSLPEKCDTVFLHL